MNGMLLHCGSETVSRAMVEAVPVPAHTRSWKPVRYADAIALVHDVAERKIKLPIESETYGLNKAGDQMFGLVTLDTGNEEQGLSIGFRGSYNKSLANGIAIGSQVFVCDNLCFSGNAFKVVRRNTTNVWRDFRDLVEAQVGQSLGYYDDVIADTKKLKEIECSDRRGYSFLGVMLGEGLLTPTQATVAFGDWKTPRHEAFAGRTLWGLYNAVTEGLKKGAPARILDRHAKTHDFFTQIQTLN